jgi:cell division transport system permease protein
MTVFLVDETKDIERKQLVTTLRLAPFTKTVRFISKESAAAEHSATIGEDFMDFLGYNPLQDALDIGLKADFVTTEVIDSLGDVMEQKPFISEVIYDRPLIVLLNKNIKRIGFWLLVCSGIFIGIALLLINHSIKLSIYSKRLIIQTMLLVGAKKSFIRRPFVLRYMGLGMLSALFALGGLAGVLAFMNRIMPQISWWDNTFNLGILAGAVSVCSLIICAMSAYFATRKHLRLTYDIIY